MLVYYILIFRCMIIVYRVEIITCLHNSTKNWKQKVDDDCEKSKHSFFCGKKNPRGFWNASWYAAAHLSFRYFVTHRTDHLLFSCPPVTYNHLTIFLIEHFLWTYSLSFIFTLCLSACTLGIYFQVISIVIYTYIIKYAFFFHIIIVYYNYYLNFVLLKLYRKLRLEKI